MRSRTRTAPLVLALGTTAAVVTGLISPVPASAAAPTTPYISEIHYDNGGADVDEFVEVTLPPGTSSAGLSIVLYNGNAPAAAVTYGSPVPLAEVTAPADVSAAVAVDTVGIQNGAPDGLALVRDGEVLEALSYEGGMTGAASGTSAGPAAGRTFTDIGVSEAGTEPAGQSLQRTYDASSDTLAWSGPSVASRGVVNGGSTTPPPGATTCETTVTHTVGEVQGSDFASPLVGETVTVEAVVVGDLPRLGGFHLQDPAADADGDAATSDGIFVKGSAPVDLGETVRVTGTVAEEFGQTQITAGSDGVVCAEGSSAGLPAPATLDLPAGADAREPLEGMLVAPTDSLSVSEVFDLTRFGELTLSEGGILVQPTELARPGTTEAEAIETGNTLRRITLDDGGNDSLTPATAPYLTPTTPVRVGDELTFTEPLVLGYGFGQWRLQPADGTAEGVFAPQNTRPESPDEVGGDVQVGAFNVLNYFLTWDGPNARGAENAEQFEKQADKIVPAINSLGADVVTLMEIEDTDSSGLEPGDADVALADLVDRLNTDAGSDVWEYVPLPQELYGVDRDVIRNAIIYKPAEVDTVGDPVGLVEEDVWFNAREPQAQTFTNDTGDAFTVVANHFKSKSTSGAPTTGDNADAGDGQGAWNGDRTRQAASLLEFTDQLATDTGDDDVLVMGDLNAYTQEDPIETLRDGGFTDLGDELDPGRYSYVFDDMSGSLDHAMATEALGEKVTDLAHWNINAVESFAYQYVGDPDLYAPDAFRSSDHDPLVLGLDLEAAPEPEPEPEFFCQGKPATLVGDPDRDVLVGTRGRDVIVARGGNDRVEARGGNDLVCAGAGNDRVLGGAGDDRIFGQAGADRLEGGVGADSLAGGPGADTLVGGPGRDQLRGNAGKDRLKD